MLRIDKQELIAGITVYADDSFDHIFYVMPEAPRFRVDDDGVPIFKFIKYREPIDRPGTTKGGGFVFFDTEFSLTPAEEDGVRQALQDRVDALAKQPGFRGPGGGAGGGQAPDVVLGTITYTKGTSGLLLKDGAGGMVEAVRSAGKPSLFGKNISAFMVELSDRGATLFEQALQGKGGSVGVVYDLYFWAKLPPLTGRAWFNASKFYSFYQTIDIEWNGMYVEDDYTETVREQFYDSESMGVEVNFSFALPDAKANQKMQDEVRSSLQRGLEDAVTRKMIPDIDTVPLEDRKAPEDIENVTRDISVSKVSSFEQTYKENTVIEWNYAPQGTLPNITNLTDKQGNAIKWEDHASTVDLNDPFFKQLRVAVSVNADFTKLPIDSVEVKVAYDEGAKHEVKEYVFTTPDKTETFVTYMENNNAKYSYSYQVNYKGESRTFQSQTITQDGDILRPSVGDMGILSLAVIPGDIDFDQVKLAQVSVKYEDQGVDPVALEFVLKDATPPAPVQKIIFSPQRADVEYQVRYFMKDGRELLQDWSRQRSTEIHVNDPLGQYKTVSMRAVGDLDTTIDTIFLDVTYDDAANNYKQTLSQALSKSTPFFDWKVPTVGEGKGSVSYSGQIRYKNGTTRPIDRAVADGTILVGDQAAGMLEVTIEPSVVDFTVVRLAKVSLHYSDPAHALEIAQDFVFKGPAPEPVVWRVPLQDPVKKEFSWQATYFKADGSQEFVAPVTTTGTEVVLPAAKAPAAGAMPAQPTAPVAAPIAAPAPVADPAAGPK